MTTVRPPGTATRTVAFGPIASTPGPSEAEKNLPDLSGQGHHGPRVHNGPLD